MKTLLLVLVLAAGCAHGIRDVSDCGKVEAADRKVECGACTLQNKAGGALGTYEYKPDNPDGKRCERQQ
jgi:hypothetical protein